MFTEQIRDVLKQHARLSADAATLEEDADLYYAGLTSLSTVNLMLAIEDEFGVEFPEAMLGRRTFQSIRSLNEALSQLTS